MLDPALERNPVEILAEEFIERVRSGEAPEIAEYDARRPDLADEIRELFPLLVEIEGARARVEATPSRGWEAEEHPKRLGDFRIVRKLGRGGMGTVYEAVQESLGRHVALKVLPATLGERSVRRFEHEARIAGKLHHSNIVPVFGVGRQDGVHYYVMQFIDGESLDALMRRLRRRESEGDEPRTMSLTSSAGRRRLVERLAGREAEAGATNEPPAPAASRLDRLDRPAFHRRVAELGIAAARALQYAADQGVLHRDVKPANLLLDREGTIWVADFGLAKSVEEEDLTATDDLPGTLRYMAPERFAGRVDIRSDVYALGLTLHELITLRSPFAATDRAMLMREISSSAIARVDRDDPTVPDDLATILAKATARDPGDRYPTAGDLALDLERFLDDRPIAARPLGPLGRARRWCRRNPTVAALSGVIGLLIAVGFASALVSAGHFRSLASSERAAKADADRLAEAERVAKRSALQRAEESEAVLGYFVRDMLAAAAPQRIDTGPLTVEEVLRRASKSVGAGFPGRPLVEASVRRMLGSVYHAQAHDNLARPHLERAVAIQSELLGRDDPQTLESLELLAEVETDDAVALAMLEEVRRARAGVDGPRATSTLEIDLAMGSRMTRLGPSEATTRLLAETEQALAATVGPDDERTLRARQAIALDHRSRGELDEAANILDRLIVDQSRILGADHPATLESRIASARLQAERGLLDRAEAEHASTLEALRRAGGTRNRVWTETLMSYQRVLARRGHPEALGQALERDLAASTGELGPMHPDTLTIALELAKFLDRRGEHDAAHARFLAVFDAVRLTLTPAHPLWARSRGNLFDHLRARGKREELLMLTEREYLRLCSMIAPADPAACAVGMNLALGYLRGGRLHEAERVARETLDRVRRSRDADHMQRGQIRSLLIQILEKKADLDAVDRLLRDEAALLGTAPHAESLAIDRARWIRTNHDASNAVDSLRRLHSENPGSKPIARELAWTLAIAGAKGSDAEAALAAARAGFDPTCAGESARVVGLALIRAGRPEEAARLLDEDPATRPNDASFDALVRVYALAAARRTEAARTLRKSVVEWRSTTRLGPPWGRDFVQLLREIDDALAAAEAP
ncbi:MAG: serine/threonine-protein kinase [Isosphaeraceae bacterium]|nr:serine/threonine-protein kinase [Isosphaeraceae bacterium]